MSKLLTVLLVFLMITPTLAAQDLVHWQDLLDAETTRSFERIQVGTDSLQFADLWLPDGEGPHPVVILIHGGCWQSIYPGVALTNPMADALARDGFAVWNVEYRRLGDDGGAYPGTFLDVAQSADFLREIAEINHLNLDLVIASGHSAGGHLATWLASRKNISPESPLYKSNPLQIHQSISLAGINNLEEYARYGSAPCGEKTVEKLVDYLNRESPFLDTSPAELLPFSASHVEISAAFDSPVPPFFGRNFVRQVQNSGGNASLILQPEAGHYEMTAPWTHEWNQVLDLFRQSIIPIPE
ncbi:alpha/beta hydrolase [Rhodohalobacter sp. SW132]|uniref:alpha/beta hydrolase n=1 Tax=Rhodohalobacter sp. SW132 TaxID=2293433 RepID=UPI001314976B|nr:alpha/beta hydrolase [Rhodohalobacter sp. SW132]